MKGVNLNIILFFLLAVTSLTAQSESVNISAWIEVVDVPDSEKIEIRGMIKNESDQELTLYQKMELTKSGGAGTAKHQQSGSFSVSPDRTKILGRSSFYKNSIDNYTVIFQIRNDLGAIFTDSLYYPEKPSIVQKETPVKKVIPNTTTKTQKPITSTRRSRVYVPVDVLEIDGLIIDETRSKIARDFYDLFYKKWIAPLDAKNFSIYIREEPSRGRGAQISLTLNDQKIFQNFVPPRYDALENVVNFAIRITRSRLSAQAKIEDQLKEEDQMGSGI